MKATLAERGQVTIPKALRRKLGLVPGTVLGFATVDGKLIAVKVRPRDPVDSVCGVPGRERSTDELVGEFRDPS